jgi:hypothetical protein
MTAPAGPAAPAGSPGGRGAAERGGARSALLRAALVLVAVCALATGGDAVGRAAAPPPPVRRLAHARAVRGALNRTHLTLSKSSLIGYDANAKCTDGSPSYVYSAAFKTPAMATTWVMYLPGTYFCWDATSCAKLQFWCEPRVIAPLGLRRAAAPHRTRCVPSALSRRSRAGTRACCRPAAFRRISTLAVCFRRKRERTRSSEPTSST